MDPLTNHAPMRLWRALLLVAMIAMIGVADARAIRFADAPCPEAGPGGIRVCPSGMVGKSYDIKLDGSGGCGPDPNVPGSGLPYQFTLLGGVLPTGLSLGRDGRLSGVPLHAGTWSFWVQLSDEDPPSASWCRPKTSEREFKVQVAAPPAAVGAAYSVTVDASGDKPQVWSLGSGQLPAGLTLDGTTGTIRGVPRKAGAFPFELSASDSRGNRTSIPLTIKVSAKLTVKTRRLPAARMGHAYRTKVRTTGGVPPVRLHVVSGHFPVGVRLNVYTGVLSGKPRKGGAYGVTIEGQDAIDSTARQRLILIVDSQR